MFHSYAADVAGSEHFPGSGEDWEKGRVSDPYLDEAVVEEARHHIDSIHGISREGSFHEGPRETCGSRPNISCSWRRTRPLELESAMYMMSGMHAKQIPRRRMIFGGVASCSHRWQLSVRLVAPMWNKGNLCQVYFIWTLLSHIVYVITI